MDADELILDYGQNLELEQPGQTDGKPRIKESSSNRKKSRSCFICPGRFNTVRRHVLLDHVPWYVAPLMACWTCNVQLGQVGAVRLHIELHRYRESSLPEWVELMSGLLLELCRQIKQITLEKLSEFVSESPFFYQCRNTFFHPTDIAFINQFNRLNKFDVDVLHAVHPPVDVYSLLHWKLLALLIKTSENSESLHSFNNKVKLYSITSFTPSIVIDAHFHWDKFVIQARFSGLPSYTWKSGIKCRNFSIQLLIAHFVFPSRWSTLDYSQLKNDSRIKITIGIHQKVVQ
jgi:hypothetical protein